MTGRPPSNLFLVAFGRHLNIGGYRRQEILREVETHLAESSPAELGNPIRLAKSIDRVHLGIFNTVPKMALIPALIVFCITLIQIIPALRYRDTVGDVDMALLQLGMTLRWFIIPILAGVILGRQVIRFHRPARVFLILLAVMYVSTVIMGATSDAFFGPESVDVPDTVRGTFFSAAFMPFITSIPAVLSAFFGVVLSTWNQFADERRTKSLRKFQATMGICLTVIWSFVAYAMMQSSLIGVTAALRSVIIAPFIVITLFAFLISIKKIRVGFLR